MANILTVPESGIYFDGNTAGSSAIPTLTGNASGVAIQYDGYAGITISSSATGVDYQDRFSIEGENGRLFGVSDQVVGSVFSVNDAAGLPLIDVEVEQDFSKITLGQFGTDAVVISGSSVQVTGSNVVTEDYLSDQSYLTSSTETYSTASELLAALLGVDGASSNLDADKLDGQQGSYYLNYNNFSNTPTIPAAANNTTITLSGGTEITTSIGNFTTNQSSPETLTINHANVSRTNTTSTASPAFGGTFTVVDGVTSNARGHVTAENVKTITLPSLGTTSTTALAGNTTVNDVSETNLLNRLAALDSNDTIYIGDAGDDTTVVVRGTLQVDGSTTTINSNTLSIGDNQIVLNNDVTGTPAQNAGIIVERGTATNASLIWDESSDEWKAGLAGSEVQLALTNGTYSGLRAQATTKADVGLSNVTNESKATMFSSPSFTGTPVAPTAATSTNTTQIATTAFVKAQNYSTADTNYYLDGITKSGNTLTFSVNGATNQTYTFGSNAFNSTTYLPLAGGTMTGALQVSVGGATGINIKQDTGSPNISGRLFFSNQTAGEGVSIYNADNKMMFQTGATFDSSTGSTRMTILASGNVGIGTTSPNGLLHVSSGTSGDAVVIIESDTDNNNEYDNPQLQFKQDGGATIAKAGLEGIAGTIFTNSLANAAYFGNDEAAALQLYTNATAQLTIESGGDVGIGDTTPSYKLDVNGTLRATSAAYFNNDATVSNNIYANNYIYLANSLVHSGDTNTYLSFATDNISLIAGGEDAIDISTGGVVINEGGLVNDFRVEGSGEANALFVQGSNGNVGIHTNTPDYELHVIGTASFTDTVAGAYFEENASHESLKSMRTGFILVMDKDGNLVPCTKENDATVFGVAKKGYKQPIIMGAEPIKVTGPIKVGDFITTSDVEGHGMKVENPQFGTIIAQAMESGSGESYNIKAMIRKM